MNIYTVRRDGSTQRTKLRRGDAGSGSARGYTWRTTGHRWRWSVIWNPPPCLHGDKQGIKHTEYSTVPSSASLTSSFSLLPSYCVGGSANRKVTVSEWGRGQKEKRKKTARESIFFFLSSYSSSLRYVGRMLTFFSKEWWNRLSWSIAERSVRKKQLVGEASMCNTYRECIKCVRIRICVFFGLLANSVPVKEPIIISLRD